MWKKILLVLGLCLGAASIVMNFFMKSEWVRGVGDIFLGFGFLSLNLVEPKRERSKTEKILIGILVNVAGLIFIIIGILNLSPVFRR